MKASGRLKPSGRRHFVASLSATLALASCASADPRLYTIAPVPGPPQPPGPSVIMLRTIGVAHYLVRRQIVRSSENYRVDVMANDWWGESLDTMLGRVLVQELGERLPHSHVYETTGAVTATPDASIEVELQRLDMDANGQLLLIAQAAVSGGARTPVARHGFRIVVTPSSTSIASQVAATSTALGQLADGIAAMLTRRTAT
jgi:uncharacterized lipoprotein YmbA